MQLARYDGKLGRREVMQGRSLPTTWALFLDCIPSRYKLQLHNPAIYRVSGNIAMEINENYW